MAGGLNGTGRVILYGHSNGDSILDTAANYLSFDEKERCEAYLFAPPRAVPKDRYGEVYNYVNEKDKVTYPAQRDYSLNPERYNMEVVGSTSQHSIREHSPYGRCCTTPKIAV